MQAYFPTEKDVPTMGGMTGEEIKVTVQILNSPVTEVPEGVDPNLIGIYQGISLFDEHRSLSTHPFGNGISCLFLVISLLAGILSHRSEWFVLTALSVSVLIFSVYKRYHYIELRLRTKCTPWEARYWLFNEKLRAQCVKPRIPAEVRYVINEARARDKIASHPQVIREIFRCYLAHYHDYDLAGHIPTLEAFNTFLHSLEPPKEEPT